MTRPILAIVGPTGTGKTALAVAAAERVAPAELLNADLRQLRRGLRVGTNAPTDADLRRVRCNLLELADPGEPFTVAQWMREAIATLDKLERREATPIVVGGTGLYVSALVDGFDFGRTPPDPDRRAERSALAETSDGLTRLAAELRTRDPHTAGHVDLRNPRRVVRALEILDLQGGSLRDARGATGRPAVLVGLDADPETHVRVLRERIAWMFESGALVAEVEVALRHGFTAEALATSGIGYTEALDVIAGRCGADIAAQRALRRTGRYAKAQRTYFRRDPRIRWLQRSGDDIAALADQVVALAGQGGVVRAVGRRQAVLGR